MIGSMLFRNLGHAGTGGLGGGGIGLLEILLLAGLGFMAYRFFMSRRQHAMAGGGAFAANRELSHAEKLQSVQPGPFAPQAGGTIAAQLDETTLAATLGRYDTSFDLTSFKDQRMDDFLQLQSAWNQRDLSSLSGRVSPELERQLASDIEWFKTSGRVNRIEQIAVRGTELVEAWQEYGQEFATLRFRANLVDYTVDESSNEVIEGDRSRPIKFEESWTFVRPVGETGPSTAWKLTAIEG
jgi:predicted lipid-binding transport protein (Tim44 family)